MNKQKCMNIYVSARCEFYLKSLFVSHVKYCLLTWLFLLYNINNNNRKNWLCEKALSFVTTKNWVLKIVRKRWVIQATFRLIYIKQIIYSFPKLFSVIFFPKPRSSYDLQSNSNFFIPLVQTTWNLAFNSHTNKIHT